MFAGGVSRTVYNWKFKVSWPDASTNIFVFNFQFEQKLKKIIFPLNP